MTDDGHGATLGRRDAAVRTTRAVSRETHEMRQAVRIAEVARALTRSLPPPRGAPYFCLDTDASYDLQVLDSFCRRGIFRKYEFALEIGSGLGGRARWLAARSYCRVVGVDPRPAAVAAAVLLNRRAQMDDQVAFQVGRLDCLPLRERVFTHVWIIDPAWPHADEGMLTEAYRVLRRGAHFALQGGPLSPNGRAALLDTLRRIGFVELEAHEVACEELSHACRVARDQLARTQDAERAAAEVSRMEPQQRRRLQVFGRRPA